MKMKTNVLTHFLLLACLLFACTNKPAQTYFEKRGDVFGTYYIVKIDADTDFSAVIDSVFEGVNRAANSYIDTSEISQFNRNGVLEKPSVFLLDMLQLAKTYHQLSNGYFEPTLYPLISAWGFGNERRQDLSQETIDSLLALVSFSNNIVFDTVQVKALKKGVMLDLSALGEGYAIEAICQALDKRGVKNYLVEIGGEMKCKGVNPNGKTWRVAIESPNNLQERGKAVMELVTLQNVGLSTSGNYRKFFVDSTGARRSHIISPFTGAPVTHNLLSASIISPSQVLADAMATACMAMGTTEAQTFIQNHPELEGFLIYADGDTLRTWKSANFPSFGASKP